MICTGHAITPPPDRGWPARRRRRSARPPAPAAGCTASARTRRCSRRIGASRSSKPASATLRRDLRAEAARGERFVDDQQPAGLRDRAQDRLGVERRDRARIDHLDRDALARRAARPPPARRRDHRASATTVTSRALAHDGAPGRTRSRSRPPAPAPLMREQLAMLEEQHRVVAPQARVEQPLGVVGRRRHDDAQAGDLGVQRVVAARVMRRRRVADADAAAQQDRHLQPAARHVLHLGDLVDDLADRVEDEVGEHEIDDRAACRSSPRRTARPTKPRSQIGVSQSRSGPYSSYSPAVVLKLPPRLPMPSPMTKIAGSPPSPSASASSVACVKVISRGAAASRLRSAPAGRCRRLGDRRASVAVRRVGPGARLGERLRLGDQRRDLGVDRVELVLRGDRRPRSAARASVSIGQRVFHSSTSSRVR